MAECRFLSRLGVYLVGNSITGICLMRQCWNCCPRKSHIITLRSNLEDQCNNKINSNVGKKHLYTVKKKHFGNKVSQGSKGLLQPPIFTCSGPGKVLQPLLFFSVCIVHLTKFDFKMLFQETCKLNYCSSTKIERLFLYRLFFVAL